MFDNQTQAVTVLCECTEEVNSSRVLPELISLTSSGQWTVVVAQPQKDNFSEELAKFLLGEESLDSWLDQARLMAEEYKCSEKEKKQRIVESLGRPH